ncbi:cyclin-dependent kinases regulatory subunit isoform X2 [Cinnamomum micranthum f. kanehirae]|uniref:Cyclin-dependent kinases regulatory subunit n=1 Tax=Cinnamomum micranthum f. kanehirae TaxID=337451 RepID=A0A443PVK7_9MAGN|nr:cyclin-dependent kinases regulatory subunit isoform X2 [Cinnamomum micranthum f. kanehirae]
MGQIQYSEKYFDDTYEYRHVVLPPEVAKLLPKNRLLMSGERLEFSRAGDGCTTPYTGQSLILCCFGGLLITSSSRRTRPFSSSSRWLLVLVNE